MIKKYNLLKFIDFPLVVENKVNQKRIKGTPKKPIFLITRNYRLENNWGINYLLENWDKNDIHIVFLEQRFDVEKKQEFFNRNFDFTLNNFKNFGLNYSIIKPKDLDDFIQENRGVLTDFNPLLKLNIPQIDCNNIIPAFYVSDKQEYNAMTFRNKVYKLINEFLTEFPQMNVPKSEGELALKSFVENNLESYSQNRNAKDVTSHLSKYLNWGFLSSQKVTLEVVKSSAPAIDKEAFLEELIIRRELSDNFCYYTSNYKNFTGIPTWAKNSIDSHREDLRTHNYSIEDFEGGKTASINWNKIQKELESTGQMHPYTRMYWAKKIFEWSPTPEYALDVAIYLNDKYAYDAPSANGYTGILWAIGGLHDRAFKDRLVTGKVRVIGEKFFKNML